MTASSRKQRKNAPPSANREYYPAFLNINGRKCVIIGGGRVAERKCAALLRAGAQVTVISPEVTRGLERYRDKGLVTHVKRGYRRGDLRSASVVVVSTDVESVNRRVAEDAEGTGVLLNVVDKPPLCNFIAPSVLRRGPLTIAISTSGVSPALARAVREELERIYGAGVSAYLRVVRGMREKALKEIGNKEERERFLKGLASEEMMSLLRRKGAGEAKKAALKRLRVAVNASAKADGRP